MALEWTYGVPTAPNLPIPKRRAIRVTDEQWDDWGNIWFKRLLKKLLEEEDDHLTEILLHMLDLNESRRWRAKRCLNRGSQNGLFRRRAIDGLVVCGDDPDDSGPAEEGGNDMKHAAVLSHHHPWKSVDGVGGLATGELAGN